MYKYIYIYENFVFFNIKKKIAWILILRSWMNEGLGSRFREDKSLTRKRQRGGC